MGRLSSLIFTESCVQNIQAVLPQKLRSLSFLYVLTVTFTSSNNKRCQHLPLITFAKDFMFSVQFVCLSAGLWKTTGSIFTLILVKGCNVCQGRTHYILEWIPITGWTQGLFITFPEESRIVFRGWSHLLNLREKRWLRKISSKWTEDAALVRTKQWMGRIKWYFLIAHGGYVQINTFTLLHNSAGKCRIAGFGANVDEGQTDTDTQLFMYSGQTSRGKRRRHRCQLVAMFYSLMFDLTRLTSFTLRLAAGHKPTILKLTSRNILNAEKWW